MQGNQRQTDWAYIAGVMDSDGCFMITRHVRKYKGRTISPCYLPCVKISQAEDECIKFITNEVGYGTYKLDRARMRQYKNGTRFGSKPMYDWFIRDRKKLIPFLKKIIPYLRIKKDRAQHVLDYCENLVFKKYGWNETISQQELNRREDSYLKMRKLNRGKVVATTKSQGSERVSDSLIS
jgi:hypothetical protein